MQTPLQIVFEHLDRSQAIEDRVRAEAERLEGFYDRIQSARVVVARPQRRSHKGDAYEVRIQLALPGAPDIVVSRAPGDDNAHTDIYVTIRDAFSAARRQLQDRTRIRQDKVKAHDVPPHGRVTALHPENDHGFIASSDGREVYFHRNSVANMAFDTLEVGTEVRFSEAVGNKGPQATHVRPIGKHHLD